MRTARFLIGTVLMGTFLAALLLIAGGPGFRSRAAFDSRQDVLFTDASKAAQEIDRRFSLPVTLSNLY